jgi:hypothetical protein
VAGGPLPRSIGLGEGQRGAFGVSLRLAWNRLAPVVELGEPAAGVTRVAVTWSGAYGR